MPRRKSGRALIAAAPDRAVGWLHHAYALRRATGGGLLAAFNALSPVADKFPDEATIPYNLACYTCQMQRDANETTGVVATSDERRQAPGDSRDGDWKIRISNPCARKLRNWSSAFSRL